MNITIDIHGQAWVAGPNPEPLDLSPGETDAMRRLKAIAAAIKALGWDGSLKVEFVNGSITCDALIALGARAITHEYSDQGYTIRTASMYVDGVEFTAQEASKLMDQAPNPLVSVFDAGTAVEQDTMNYTGSPAGISEPEPFDEFTGV